MGEAAKTHHHAISWSHPDSAIRHLGAHARLWLLAAAGLTADLLSKWWAFENLEVDEVREWVPRFLDFQLSLNPGALFGIGSGLVSIFIVAGIAALGFVVYLFSGTTRNQRVVHVALSFILAGALGNLHDRALNQHDMATMKSDGRSFIGTVVEDRDADTVSMRHWSGTGSVRRFAVEDLDGPVRRVGVVRDFLKITPKFGQRDIWPWVFNVADVFLVAGVLLLMLSFWTHAGRAAPASSTGDEAPAVE
jgi:lipoprotein signal peptidase